MNNRDLNESRTIDKKKAADANRDPITGTPGAHPVGTGVGATGGGLAGAAIGASVGGPVGAAVGLAVGAVAGGLAGTGAAEAFNPTEEDAYWRENYSTQPWVERNMTYDDYHPAFRTGYEGYSRYGQTGRTFDDAETDLRRDYDKLKGKSRLGWEKAKAATRAAWGRVERPRSRLDEARHEERRDANRDPITGTPGAHPVGTGVGATGGGATGAAIGAAVGGPVGAAVGLAAGAVAGGLAGKGTAEAINPTAEDAYWRSNYTSQSWADRNRRFEDYQPAFRTGYEGYRRYAGTGKTFDQVEPDLQRDYQRVAGTAPLTWDNARNACRAAWDRVDCACTGRTPRV